jgi:hypothetical protein
MRGAKALLFFLALATTPMLGGCQKAIGPKDLGTVIFKIPEDLPVRDDPLDELDRAPPQRVLKKGAKSK